MQKVDKHVLIMYYYNENQKKGRFMEEKLLPIEEAQRKYAKSDKGRETQERWNSSEAKKASQGTYFKSEKGMAARLRYYLSEKGLTSRQKRNESQKLLRKCYKFLLVYPDKSVEDFLNSLKEDSNE